MQHAMLGRRMSELSRIIANKTLVTIIKENIWIIMYIMNTFIMH